MSKKQKKSTQLFYDVLIEIFLFLRLEDFKNKIYLINKVWNYAFKDNFLWYKISKNHFDYPKAKFDQNIDYYSYTKQRIESYTKNKRISDNYLKITDFATEKSIYCTGCCYCKGLKNNVLEPNCLCCCYCSFPTATPCCFCIDILFSKNCKGCCICSKNCVGCANCSYNNDVSQCYTLIGNRLNTFKQSYINYCLSLIKREKMIERRELMNRIKKSIFIIQNIETDYDKNFYLIQTKIVLYSLIDYNYKVLIVNYLKFEPLRAEVEMIEMIYDERIILRRKNVEQYDSNYIYSIDKYFEYYNQENLQHLLEILGLKKVLTKKKFFDYVLDLTLPEKNYRSRKLNLVPFFLNTDNKLIKKTSLISDIIKEIKFHNLELTSKTCLDVILLNYRKKFPNFLMYKHTYFDSDLKLIKTKKYDKIYSFQLLGIEYEGKKHLMHSSEPFTPKKILVFIKALVYDLSNYFGLQLKESGYYTFDYQIEGQQKITKFFKK